MKSLGTCYSERAIKVCDPDYCSSPLNKKFHCPKQNPQASNSVTSIYRVNLSNHKRLLITLSWCKYQISGCLIIGVSDNLSSPSKYNEVTCAHRDKKGMETMQYGNSIIEVSWNLSKAKYAEGPEAVDNYFLAVLCDSEICLLLGDMDEEVDVRRLKTNLPAAKFSLVARNVHLSGDTIYSTKAQFSDTGPMHDVVIKCFSSEDDCSRSPVLSVEIDKRVLFQVKRLRWNFRGNMNIYVDGLLVDMMWDVHDWFLNPESGCALFLFRRRTGFQSRLWLEENSMEHKKQDNDEFSLLILARRDTD